MAEREFQAQYLLGCGTNSFIYSVASLHPHDRDETYALKRYFLRNPSCIIYASKELNILKKIALDSHASPFLPTLYYSLVIELSPVFVLTKALGFTILDLLKVNGPLKLNQAKFFVAEVICGLKYLHKRQIVHMELKTNNVLLTKTGHILISDFDRSYDLLEGRRPPCRKDFIVNAYFSAPEIANEEVITDKADIWSLGVLTASMIGKGIRSRDANGVTEKQEAKTGNWKINGFSEFSKSLQEYFTQVFTRNYILRPNIEQVQNLKLFKNVDWSQVERLETKPPFSNDRLIKFIDGMNRDYNPFDPVLLESLYTYEMPLVERYKFRIGVDFIGRRYFNFIRPNIEPLTEEDLTPQEVLEELKKFKFIHPVLSYRRLLSK